MSWFIFLFICSFFSYLFMWLDQVLVAADGFSCSEAPGILVLQLVIEPVSSASEGRFLTAGPPGKSLLSSLYILATSSLFYVLPFFSPSLSWSFPPPVLNVLRCGFAPCRCLSEGMLPHSGCRLTQHLSIHVSEKTWNRFQGRPLQWERQDSFSSFPPPTAFSVSVCLFFRTVITNHH